MTNFCHPGEETYPQVVQIEKEHHPVILDWRTIVQFCPEISCMASPPLASLSRTDDLSCIHVRLKKSLHFVLGSTLRFWL